MANKVLTIPVESGFPSVDVWVNGKKYSYPTGQEVSVPEEVAAILQAKYSALPEAKGSVEKLDKVTTTSSSNRLYGISPSGEQKLFNVSYTPISAAVPMYSGSGTLRTSSPTESTHCANKAYVDALKPITNDYADPQLETDAGHLGRLYMNEASDEMFYANEEVMNNVYTWQALLKTPIFQTTAPTSNTAGQKGQLYLVGSSDFWPFDVYICIHSDAEKNQYVWHKMCTTEAQQ